MKLKEAISQFDELLPNSLSDSLKTKWISEIDNLVCDLHMNYVLSEDETAKFAAWSSYTEADSDTELLIPEPYEDAYLYYMTSKLNYIQQDIPRYNNSQAMYQNLWDKYSGGVNRTHPAVVHNLKAFESVTQDIIPWEIP